VPPPNNIGLGYAIWSYYGDLRVTISADTGIEVDPWRLAELFEEEVSADGAHDQFGFGLKIFC
jgi:hypothetical protein